MLVFDAPRAEGEWEQSRSGTVFGFHSFAAAVVRELCRDDQKPDFEQALVAGIGAARELRRFGHGRVTITQKNADGSESQRDNPKLGFLLAEVADRLQSPGDKFVSACIPNRLANRGSWMMLDEWQVHAHYGARSRPHFEAARAAKISRGTIRRITNG